MKKYSVNTYTFILEKKKINKTATEKKINYSFKNYTKKIYEEQKKKDDLIYHELDKISFQLMKDLFD